MKIIAVFPTNRLKRLNETRERRERRAPNNVFFGVNNLGPGTHASIISVSPELERLVNLFLGFLAWPFQSRFTRLNLGRAMFALPALRNAQVVISCVDSVNKALLLFKKVGLLRKPIICMAGNVMDGTERFPNLHRWLWSAADRVMTHAPVDQEKLERMGLGDRGVMIPVGSDEDFYVPSTKKPNPNLIVSIGSDRDRDYEMFVSAARNLPHLTFEIHAAQQNMNSADLPENVRFVTGASQTQSRELLRRASIVAIPLKETRRAAGQLALMDALLMEKPVIISLTRGVAESYQLIHKKTVLLVPPGNINALIRSIKTLHLDESLRRKLGEEGRKLALRYTTKQYAEKLRGVINDVLKTTVRSAS